MIETIRDGGRGQVEGRRELLGHMCREADSGDKQQRQAIEAKNSRQRSA
jgi:hypothetical protein